VAIGLAVLGVGLTHFFEKTTPGSLYGLPLYGALLSAIWGGYGPGLVASIISAVGVGFFVIPPVGHSFDILRVVFYVLTGVIASAFAASIREAYRQLESSRKEAEDAARAREVVISVVAHDLRNPLSAIGMEASLLHRTLQTRSIEFNTQQVESIEQSVKRMDHLIGDLLDAVRIEAGKFSLQSRELDIPQLVEEGIRSLKMAAAQKEIQIEKQIGTDLPRIRGDDGRILQVITNLLSKAVKFSPRGSRVRISARAIAQGIEVSVRDQGRGIPEDQIPLIFDRYWQAQTKDAKNEGVGLGLFISQGIIRAHGGQIRVESQVGRGSTFSFTLSANAAPKAVLGLTRRERRLERPARETRR